MCARTGRLRAAGWLAGSIALLLTLAVWGHAQSDALAEANDVRAEPLGVMARRGWSPPEIAAVTGLRGVLRPNPLAIDPGGDAIAVWEEELSTGSASTQKAVRAAVRPATGTWRPALTLSIEGSHPDAAVDGRGEAIVAWETRSGDEVSMRTPAGAWLPPQSVQAGPGPEPQAAMDSRGDVVLISPSEEGLYAAVRPAGGTFSRGRMISARENIGFGPLLVGNARGDAFVTWTGDSAGKCFVRAAFRPADGTWSTPHTLAECQGGRQLAIDARGDAIVVWGNRRGGYLEAAERSAVGRWTRAHVIARPPNLRAEPQVGMDARGDAIVVWAEEGSTAASPTLWTESHPAGQRWEPPQPVPYTKGGGPLFAPPSLAVDARGDALIAWQDERGIEAIARAAGGPWQPRHTISGHEPGHIDHEEAPLAQVDARGDGVVSWQNHVGTYTAWHVSLFR